LKEKHKVFDLLNLDKLLDSLSRFVEIKMQIYELKFKGELVEIISSIAALTMILTLGIIMLFFFSLALGFFLNDLFGSSFMGFAIIGAFYMLSAILLAIFKDKLITNRLFNSFFSKTLISENDEQEEDA
jgi:hypothetical protein